jgi:hypothetical protein
LLGIDSHTDSHHFKEDDPTPCNKSQDTSLAGYRLFYGTVLLEFWQLAYHNRYNDLPKDFQDAQKQLLPPKATRPHHLVPHLSWVTQDSLYERCVVVEEESGVFESAPLSKQGKEKNWVMLIRGHKEWHIKFTD